MNNRTLGIYIIIAALAGGIIGSVVSSGTGSAAAFSIPDFFKSLIPGTLTATTTVTSSNVVYLPAVDYEEKIIQAVEKSEPAVVSIVISKDVPLIENCPTDPFGNLPPEFRQFFGDNGDSIQPCKQSGGTTKQEVGGGSGFILSSDGLIVTNRHVVVDESASYTVFTNDGKKYTATVVARDPALDFAVLRINATNLPTVTIGNSEELRLGQTVIAIGNALGEFRNTVSVGVVSGLQRNVTAGGGGQTETIENVIQTDAAINPGNSGGPLLNLKGEVIGINTAVASGAQNIGFAIPINQANRAIQSIKQSGRIILPYIGVRYTMITEDLETSRKLPSAYGALIRGTTDDTAVIAGSPADKAGLKAEDIILEVNGQKLSDGKTLGSAIQNYSVGDMIALKVMRGNQTITINVKLEERPKS